MQYNEIANNIEAGVVIESGVGHAVLYNSIHSNVNGLGIDLGDDGVTANDPGDGDGGPNFGMNTPEIYSVEISRRTRDRQRRGATRTRRSSSRGGPDPSSAGEGQTFLYRERRRCRSRRDGST